MRKIIHIIGQAVIGSLLLTGLIVMFAVGLIEIFK